MQSEAEIQHAIRLSLGAAPDLTLWRNSTGVSERTDRNGRRRFERHGLVKGASDLIGVLAPHGRWFVLEVKREDGTATREQIQFLELVRRRGGFGAIVRSVDEARAALDRARAGESE